MPQFFLAPGALAGEAFRLAGPEAFHISRVLRLREGEILVLFDGRGARFEGVIDKIHPDGAVSGRIRAKLDECYRPPARLRLYQGLLKAGPWDLLLQKATELGVSAVVPVLTPYTVVLLRAQEQVRAKRERWSRVVLAAAKQCGRPDLPEIGQPRPYREALTACRAQGPSLTLLAWEGLAGARALESLRPSLREALEKGEPGAELTVNLFIGPEGGFTEEEVELAQSLGVHVFGLGPRTLRAETAALAVCALLQYELGAL